MSVNRQSDLNTSLSRTDGVKTSYLNLSSADRDKNVDTNSNNAELSFDEQFNVIGIFISILFVLLPEVTPYKTLA